MIQGVYSVATAMDVAQQAQDTTAQNLANANVPGYRARGLAFESFDSTMTAKTSRSSHYGRKQDVSTVPSNQARSNTRVILSIWPRPEMPSSWCRGPMVPSIPATAFSRAVKTVNWSVSPGCPFSGIPAR